jgi:hypothetical protein
MIESQISHLRGQAALEYLALLDGGEALRLFRRALAHHLQLGARSIQLRQDRQFQSQYHEMRYLSCDQ